MTRNEKLLEEIQELRSKITELETAVTEKVQAEEALRAANQQLEAGNQQLSASEQQLRAVNQQLEASEQQLRAVNQQLSASAKQLRASEEKYRAIDDASKNFIYSYDKKNRFTHANRSLCRALGLDPGEIIGKTYAELDFPQAECEKWDRLHRKVYETNTTVTAESTTLIPGGEERSFEIVLNPLHDGEGSIIGIAGISRDITERKKSEKALIESEAKWKSYVQNAPYGVFIADKNGRYVEVNPTASRITGYSQEELLEKSIPDMLPPESREKGMEHFKKLVGDGVSIDEIAFLHKNGEIRHWNVSAVRLNEESFLGFVDDTTEARRTERLLYESKEELAQIVDGSSISTLVINAEHKVTHWNRACEELTGCRAENMCGTNIHWKAFYPAERPILADIVMASDPEFEVDKWYPGKHRKSSLLEEAMEVEDFFPNLGKEGKWLYFTAVPIRSADGEIKGAIETLQDITERKLAEQSLLESEDRFTTAMDAANTGLWDWNLITNEIYYSPAWKRMLGYEPEELPNSFSVWEELGDPEDIKKSWEMQKEVVSGKRDLFEMKFRMRHKEGHWVSILSRANVFHNDQGIPARMIGTHVDISDIEQSLKEQARARREKELILESVSELVIYSNTKQEIQWANRAALESVGLTSEEAVGKSCYEIWGTGNSVCKGCPVVRSIESGEPRTGEITTLDGRIWTVSGYPVKTANGDIEGAVEVARDITARKLAEEALKENEAKYRNLFEAASDGIYLIRQEDGSLAEVNKVACNMLGRTREEILTLTIGDIDPNYPLEGFIEFWKDRPEEEPYIFETTHRRKDGTLLPVEVSGIKYRIGDQVLLYGRARDITERYKAEKKLRDQKAMMARTEKIAHVGSWEWEIEKDCVTWSDELFNLFGLDPALGAPPFAEQYKIYLPEDFDKLKEAVRACTEEGIPYHLELRALRADGEIVDCNVSGAAEKGPDGKINRLYGFLQDISDRKRTEEEKGKLQAQLIQAQRMESVGRLAGGVAHDYNNMLSVILGYTEMALEEVTPDQSVYGDLQEIYKAADRSREITRQLLAFARRQTIDPRILEINGTIQGMLNMLERLIGEDIELIWKPGEDIWPVKMDPSQAEQVLANLCINSRDAIDGVGKIVIETGNKTIDESYCKEHIGFLPGEFVMLSVSDDGCGMDNATLENVFEPFFTTKGLEKGSGLGLATVHGIVKQNGGNIIVLSEVGIGTTFKIFLPRSSDVSQTVATSGSDPIPEGKGERVLLVEDEPAIMKMSKMLLDRLGYVVLGAETPEEALQLAGKIEGSLDLLMTDVVMPGMNGRDLADKVQSIFPDIGILFMSGYTAEIIAQRGVIDDRMNFLQKPFSKKALALKVRQALDQ